MAEKTLGSSYFDGGLFGLICIGLLTGLLTIFTLGIALPWAVCIQQNWLCGHTVIDGRRLVFTGKGWDFLLELLKILGLCIITLGLYIFWANIAIYRWMTKNTHSTEDTGKSPLPF